VSCSLQAGKRNDVSDSYAKALVELADEKNTLEQVHSDVDAIAALVKENKKFADLMYNPVVEADKKKAVIQEISKGAGFQKYTTNFLKLLVEKDRVNLLNEICESFEEQYCQLTDTQVRRGPRGAGTAWHGISAAAAAAATQLGTRNSPRSQHSSWTDVRCWAIGAQPSSSRLASSAWQQQDATSSSSSAPRAEHPRRLCSMRSNRL
jgi:hypothetical protein